jgi:hypothetical protein
MADKEDKEVEDDGALSGRISIKALAGLVGSVGVLIAAVVGIESRYVHADEYTLAQAGTEMKIDQSALEQRQWLLNDRISNIELKAPSNRSEYDNAQLERYKRDLENTEKRMRQIENEQRSLRVKK